MIIVGIDPGASGGIAMLSSNAGAEPVSVYRMPETELDVVALFRGLTGEYVKAFIEKVHSSPQMGVSSAFSFGRCYGMLRTALIACEVPFDEVTPQRWQAVIGGLASAKNRRADGQGFKGRDKNVSKRRAQELFPSVPKITHAVADALLIAEYGRRMER